MSKYIDELTELICDTVRTVFPNASLDDGYDVADEVIAKLPTIEVSEDCISKAYLEHVIEIQAMPVKNNEEYLRGWNNALYKVVKLIEKAPSVVPKARPIEMHLDVTDDVVDRAVEQIRAEGKWIKEKRGG